MQKPNDYAIELYQHLKVGRRYACIEQEYVFVRGDDRLPFLQHVCTANVNSLKPGENAETFLLDEDGLIAGYGFLIVTQTQVVIAVRTMQQATDLIQHLHRLLSPDFAATVSPGVDEFSVFFSQIPHDQEALLEILDELPAKNRNVVFEPFGEPVTCAHLEIAGPGWLVITTADSYEECFSRLYDSCGSFPIMAQSRKTRSYELDTCWNYIPFEMLRIETQTPWYGLDFSHENSPLEIGRNDKAICNTKEDYLGKKAVDALAQTGATQQLRLVKFGDKATVPGSNLLHPNLENEVVGIVKSVCWSPCHNQFIGWAMIESRWLPRLVDGKFE